jgi:hypothetical protein
MAVGLGHRPCRYRASGCVHRFGVDLVAPSRRTASYRPDVEVRAPDGFVGRVTPRRDQGPVDEDRVEEGSVDKATIEEATVGKVNIEKVSVEEIDVTLRSAPRDVSPGGPVLALGEVVGRGAVVGRVGWEIFAPTSVAHGFAVDATTEGAVTVAYLPQIVTGSWLLLPSLGLGLGLPVQLAPLLTSGLRFQASLALPLVGLVTWLDVLPRAPEPLRGCVALQLSL